MSVTNLAEKRDYCPITYFDTLAKNGNPQIVEITPHLAEYFLTRNVFPDQRKLSDTRVISLAGAMSRGEWRYTGQGITFDKQGRLLDGQTRLAAIVKSQVTVKMLVAFNVDEEAFRCIDSNLKPRSLSDVTGLDRRYTEILKFAFYMLPGERTKATADQALMLHSALHPIIGEDYERLSKATKRFYSNVPSKMAVLLRLATCNPRDKYYIHDLYSKMISTSPEASAHLPLIGYTYKSYVDKDKIPSQSSGRLERKAHFAYAWFVYDPQNSDKARIPIYSKDYSVRMSKINETFNQGRKILYDMIGNID